MEFRICHLQSTITTICKRHSKHMLVKISICHYQLKFYLKCQQRYDRIVKTYLQLSEIVSSNGTIDQQDGFVLKTLH